MDAPEEQGDTLDLAVDPLPPPLPQPLPTEGAKDEVEGADAAPIDAPADPDDPRVNEAVRYLFLTAGTTPEAMRAVGFTQEDSEDREKQRWIRSRLRHVITGPVVGPSDLRVELAARRILEHFRETGKDAEVPELPQMMREEGFAEEDCGSQQKQQWVSRRLEKLSKEGTSIFPPLTLYCPRQQKEAVVAQQQSSSADAPQVASAKTVNAESPGKGDPAVQEARRDLRQAQSEKEAVGKTLTVALTVLAEAEQALATAEDRSRAAEERFLQARAAAEEADLGNPDCPWNQMLRRLEEFVKLHGHCRISKVAEFGSDPELRRLDNWTRRQRNVYRDYLEGKRSTNKPHRFLALERLGVFVSKWHLKYKDLLAFREEHGHCNVPTKRQKDKQLGAWVACQR